jgi:hypothetical protein
MDGMSTHPKTDQSGDGSALLLLLLLHEFEQGTHIYMLLYSLRLVVLYRWQHTTPFGGADSLPALPGKAIFRYVSMCVALFGNLFFLKGVGNAYVKGHGAYNPTFGFPFFVFD